MQTLTESASTYRAGDHRAERADLHRQRAEWAGQNEEVESLKAEMARLDARLDEAVIEHQQTCQPLQARKEQPGADRAAIYAQIHQANERLEQEKNSIRQRQRELSDQTIAAIAQVPNLAGIERRLIATSSLTGELFIAERRKTRFEAEAKECERRVRDAESSLANEKARGRLDLSPYEREIELWTGALVDARASLSEAVAEVAELRRRAIEQP